MRHESQSLQVRPLGNGLPLTAVQIDPPELVTLLRHRVGVCVARVSSVHVQIPFTDRTAEAGDRLRQIRKRQAITVAFSATAVSWGIATATVV
ncbi:MAG: hypothetical protein R3B91_11980 [Planctomycetaceae bacterium]